ncbi:MAG: aminotransferase class [Phycisphaerales bacterium]|nr:aminotransferase class [Phycisphaerales bacterium]
MDDAGALTFKIASEPGEFEQIHRLNYKTFVEEIPQHPGNERGVLVDRFHDENTYAVCMRGNEVIGMMALRCQRPFSLDQKLGNLDQYLPGHRAKVVEVRLLAAEKDRRGGRVFAGLMAASARYLVRHGYDMAVISGTTRQLRLYRHMGFVPFGPLIGTPGAMYQPMYLTRERFEEAVRAFDLSLEKEEPAAAPVSFLPGPVDVTAEVRAAFAAAPESHRAEGFLRDFRATQMALCGLVNARHVQVLTGSGTLGNDVIAAQLSLEASRGLILSNGEFGDRLVDHARRMRLEFSVVRRPWGEVIDSAEIEMAIAAAPDIKWIWAVHCETSTGVLNDLGTLKAICDERGIRLCLDCISSIGTTPVDLAGVHLASGVSGKGLRAYPGLCMVFHDREIAPAPDHLPRYLDLGSYADKAGVPFTVCSNLVYALKAAVEQIRPAARFAEIAEHASRVRAGLAEIGLATVAEAAHASPAVVTIALPRTMSAVRLGDALATQRLLLSYRSDYLLACNWIQICLMGQYSAQTIERMLSALGESTRLGSRGLAGRRDLALSTTAV